MECPEYGGSHLSRTKHVSQFRRKVSQKISKVPIMVVRLNSANKSSLVKTTAELIFIFVI